MEKKSYYITTAIAYTSGKPHIGNVYEIVLADSIARFKRAQGFDVFFQTGTDEHGQKNELKALERGLSPQQFVDEIAGVIRSSYDSINTSYDKFIRTTDDYHQLQVQKIFKKLFDQGDIYKSIYEGWYCTPCESFYTDGQLDHGKCPDCGREVHREKEESYFFRLSKYQDRLMKYIQDNPHFIQPESRKNEMINNFLKPGLNDLAVSRTSFKWGIPVDFDPKHVVYVWIDALSNYITGLGYDVDGNHGDLYKKYWPADVHLIGKDILRFHTLYWPIMLMALDVELPKQVFGHPWLLVGEGKMSKSKGNVIYADDLIKLLGVDAVRYIMLHEMPFAQDGTVTMELMIERVNSDLANIMGNLVNRTWAMSQKYFSGVVENTEVRESQDDELIELASALIGKVEEAMEGLHVADAIDEIITVLRRCNKYIDETTPWGLAKDEANLPRLKSVLYHLLESIRICGVALGSFIPETSEKILTLLNTNQRSLDSARSFGLLESDHLLSKDNVILFGRLDVKETLTAFEELTQPKKIEVTPGKPEISFDEFGKVELKVGVVLSCEKHPEADKLLVSQIDTGDKVRQIVSGISPQVKPEDMVGKKVIVVTNLKPAVIRKVTSEGMILVAEEGKSLEVVSIQHLPKGSIVR
ncbi:MAG: methionine--tRNA ligase [Erysipelotrichaceae bacterium]|nr:methionine--tRNA ligase [Erysipelotrichaceae bacterium]